MRQALGASNQPLCLKSERRFAVLSEYVIKLGGSNWLFIIKLIKPFVTYTEKIEEYQEMIL